uniref:Uncharacterized protein n=1 Tax=Oryza punctata TaxID=4537 RepID=A0A0E0M1S3_ORYPU
MAPSKPLLSDFVAAVLSKTKTKRKSKAKPDTSGSNPGAAMEIEKPEEAAQPVAMEVDGKLEREKEVDGKPKKKEVSKKARKACKLAVQSLEKYYGDRTYRFLFDCVAEFFAELLASDLEQLAPGGIPAQLHLCVRRVREHDRHADMMDVCLALGVLISELSEEPWAGRVITFSVRPQIHMIKGKTLAEKLRDMEFDEASTTNHRDTDYEAICRKFGSTGYGDAVPQIVFWNLRDSKSTRVTSTQPVVAMIEVFNTEGTEQSKGGCTVLILQPITIIYHCLCVRLLERLKRYGAAGVLSYGLLNTVYYVTTFLLVWFYFSPAPGKMGYTAAVERFLKLMAMVWAGSQVTKILRAGGALALAPFVDRGLRWFTVRFNFKSEGKAFATIVGFCFALAALLFFGLTILWA